MRINRIPTSLALSMVLITMLPAVPTMAAVNRTQPTANVDSTTAANPSRAGTYLEAYTLPFGAGKQWLFADEGQYFCTYNVTDGTGIAGHAAPVQADLSTKPLLHIWNGSSTKRLYPDFVRIRVTAVGAGATTTDFTLWVDNAGASNKTSGGTVATVVNALGGGAADGDTVVTFGAVVATAPSTEKRIDHQRVRSVVPVVEDQYVFSFGTNAYAMPAALATTGTAVLQAEAHLPPIVVPPLGNLKLVEWGASQSGAHSFEFSVCYWRR